MPHPMGFFPSIELYPRYSSRLLNHTHVRLNGLSDNHFGIVRLPSPFSSHGIFMMSPAKDAFVGACQGGRGFHALIRSDAVVGVFVAAASSAELMFGPSA